MNKPKLMPPKSVLDEHFIIDVEAGKVYWKKHPFFTGFEGKEVSTDRMVGYSRMRVPGFGSYAIHRVIWFYHTGREPNYLDHVNRIKTDNRIINLRECTATENTFNKKYDDSNNLGFKGISVLRSGRYQARVSVNGVRVSLGSFVTKQEAVEARLKYLSQIMPEFSEVERFEAKVRGIEIENA